jgi:hypothetical protein
MAQLLLNQGRRESVEFGFHGGVGCEKVSRPRGVERSRTAKAACPSFK